MTVQLMAQVDSTYRFYFYDQRESHFRSLPDTPGEIIMLGNSITNGANWHELFHNPNIKNRGISGDNTFGVLNRLDEITASRPHKVFILIGINDLSKDTPVEVILNNYRRIVETIQLQSPETRIYLQSVLPTNSNFPHFPRAQNKDAQIRQLNKGIEDLAQQSATVFIDLYPHFLSEDGKLSAEYTNDGLHLMGAGYVHWVNILRPWVEEPLSAPTPNSTAAFGGLYYERRREIHENAPTLIHATVMLGNSLTEQGLWSEWFPGQPILNRGIGGDPIAGIRDRLPAILERNPQRIFLMAGINNILFRDAQAQSLAKELRQLLLYLQQQSPNTKVYLQSVLPVNEIMAENKAVFLNKHSVIQAYNAELARICSELNIPFIDLYPAFADEYGRLKPQYTSDGIHLTGAGYALWVQLLGPWMQE